MDWFRYYVSTLDNRKIQALPGPLFKSWVNFMSLARAYDGVLPDLETMSFRLRCSVKQVSDWMYELLERRLIDEAQDGTYSMHEWNLYQYPSDDAARRKRKQRQGRRLGHVTGQGRDMSRDKDGTCPVLDTEQIQNRTDTEGAHGTIDFEDQVEKLYRRHPKKRNKTLVPPALFAALDRATFTVIDSAHEILCRSEQWTKQGGQFAPQLAEWLADEGWTAVDVAPAVKPPTYRKGDGSSPYEIYVEPEQ